MDLNEYNKVKKFNYLEYCDYLQNEYGIGFDNYFTKNFNKSFKVSRTSEGLFAHHKFENKHPLLSKKETAERHPYEYQKAENIVYCDWLEHFFLHILICEEYDDLSLGGILCFFIPELNDIYSGVLPDNTIDNKWKINCINKIKDDVEVYLRLLNRYAVCAAPKKNISFGKYGIDTESFDNPIFHIIMYSSKNKSQNKSGNEVYIYRENEYKFYDKKRKILLANHFCFLCHVWIGNHITLEVPNDEYKNTVQSISRRNYCLSCKKQKR